MNENCEPAPARPDTRATVIDGNATSMLDGQPNTGTQPSKADPLGQAPQGCLHGTTKVITENGTFSLEQLASTEAAHKILSTRSRWLLAKVAYAGQQELLRIHVVRQTRKKEILAGADQIWFVYRTRDIVEEVRTSELLPGQHLKSVWSTVAGDRVPAPVAIMHGIVFGDGTHPRYQTRDWNPSCRVTLCGEKQELSCSFTGHRMTPVAAGLDVTGLPHYFKQLPNITESDSYLFGWLQGYFATDGSASGCISSVSKSTLIFARDVATRIGLPTYGIRESEQNGYTGGHTLYSLPFALAHLPEDFFLRAKHKAGLVFERNRRNLPRWSVTLVERTGIVEPAYCAHVRGDDSFSLEDNILTQGGASNIRCKA